MKTIGKWTLKCVCAIMPFIILGHCINRDMFALVDPSYIWNREKTNTTQEKKYRVVVIGDSMANASYVPEVLSSDTINLSLGGSTPMENYYTLQDWLAHNSAPDVCYISFDDGHFLVANYFWTAMWAHRYSLKQDVEMLKAAAFYQEPSILVEQSLSDFISSQMYLPRTYITSIWDTSFYKTYETNSNFMRVDELHAGHYLGRDLGEYEITDPMIFDEFQVNPLFDEYYRKIIELCLENGITPRIVKLPLPDTSEYTDNYNKMFYAYYDSLQAVYPSLTVDWETKTYPKNLFTDTRHMNAHGGLQFSLDLKERHPEDFATTESDAGQNAAIDDSIREENKIEWILRWIAGRDYTVLFYDKRGDFKDVYANQIQVDSGVESSQLIKIPVEDTTNMMEEAVAADNGTDNAIPVTDTELIPARRNPDVWAVTGTGRAALPFSISSVEGGLSLQLEGQEPQAWVTSSDDMLGVAVVNHSSNTVVCMKTFVYVDGALQLLG